MKICKQCNIEYEDNMKFCPECGTKLEDVRKTCPNCGSEYKEGQKFCSECGQNLEQAAHCTSSNNTNIDVEELYHKALFIYENEEVTPDEEKEVVEYFTIAAEKGHAEAQHYLGKIYEEGFGVNVDISKSEEWYKKSFDSFTNWQIMEMKMRLSD